MLEVLIIGGGTDKTKSVHLDSFQPISISLWPLFQRESSLRYEYRFSDVLNVDFIIIKNLALRLALKKRPRVT